MTDIARFVKSRNNALFSLDEKKIKAHLKRYGVPIPENEEVFWIGVYKSILAITDAPEELQTKAVDWLISRGYSLMIGGFAR